MIDVHIRPVYQYPDNLCKQHPDSNVGDNQDMDTLAQRLKQTREEAHLSQTELAERAGCSQGLIGNLESGNQKTSSKLPRIAQVLGVEPLWLAEGKGPKRRAAEEDPPLAPFARIFDALASLPEEEAELWVSRVLTAAAEHRAEVARAKRQREAQSEEPLPGKDRRAS